MKIGKFSETVKKHYICIIIGLIMIVIGILTGWLAGSQEALNYLGLSSSIISIILGVVVIVFTIFQSNRSEVNISNMRELIIQCSNIISEKSNIFEDGLGVIQKDIGSIFESLTESKINSDKKSEIIDNYLSLYRFNIVTFCASYLIYKGFQTQKFISTSDIRLLCESSFGSSSRFYLGWITGALTVFVCLFKRDPVLGERRKEFIFKDVPTQFIRRVEEETEKYSKKTNEISNKFILEVNDFFQ